MPACFFFTFSFAALLIASCAKITTVQPPADTLPLPAKTYKKIILQKFEISRDMEDQYRDIIVTCESAVMNELLQNNAAPMIEKARVSTSRDPSALIVATRMITLTLAGSSPRVSDSETGPKSEMVAEIRLIDAQTKKVLLKSTLSSSELRTPEAALAEQTLPVEFGKMIAGHILSFVASRR